MKKIETISFNGYEPNIAELSKILTNAGFRPLSTATEEDLPAGALALIYNARSHTVTPIIICRRFIRAGFTYICVEQMYNDPDVEYWNTNDSNCKDKFYKVVMLLPVSGNFPDLEMLPTCVENLGFQSLAHATPDDIPQGCVALLYDNRSRFMHPIIVRVMSVSNQRFLYLYQSMSGNWVGTVKMGLDTLKNYSYWVVS